MDLGIAGVLSGAGEGMSKALALGQAQYGAERLQTMRDEGDRLRDARMMEHQERLQGKTIRAQAAEGDASRGQAKALHEQALTHAETQTQQLIDKNLELAKNESSERLQLHKAQQGTQLTIAREHNQVLRDLDKIRTSLQVKATTASELSSIVKALGDKRADLRAIKRDLLDPMKNDSSQLRMSFKG